MEEAKSIIIKTLSEKMQTKKQVWNNISEVFRLFADEAELLANDYNEALSKQGGEAAFEVKRNGNHELDLRIADDVLVFQLSPHIFEFHKSHGVWKISYVYNDELTSYAGIINIYNFLNDSLLYNRGNDLGYLIGRVFVNKDKHFFVEGKRQLGFLYNDYGNAVITEKDVHNIIDSAVLYSLDFDMLVPPYNEVKMITVSDVKERGAQGASRLGKRLGFKFYADNE